MYIRFQAPDGEGLFSIAYALSRAPELSGHEQRQVSRWIEWFESHLPAVPRTVFNRAGVGRVRCWFRSEARAHIDAAWELTGLIERFGRTVQMDRVPSLRPVVFRDRYQVAVRLPRPRRQPESPRQPWDGSRQTIRLWP